VIAGPSGYREPEAITPLRDPYDIAEYLDFAESSERSEPAEPTDNTEKNDPTEPIEHMDPMEPIDRIDPLEPIESREFSDHSDQRDEGMGVSSTPHYPPRPGSAARDRSGPAIQVGLSSVLVAQDRSASRSVQPDTRCDREPIPRGLGPSTGEPNPGPALAPCGRATTSPA
jgi:hypothetical protein